ncbi:MAG: ComEA family DNA-binding protein [Planctomycetes bacterium]|nr:ComEA family DNA-binding protein [Planctomycetota bacterium]
MPDPERSENPIVDQDLWEARALQSLDRRNRAWRSLAVGSLLLAIVWVTFDTWRPTNREPLPAEFVVDINRASLRELNLIPGIGPKSAEAIVAYRSSAGGFTDVEELTRIPGIKDGKLRALRPYVTVDPRHAQR